MKGVSPVISAALLLLMAVGIAASTYFWMSSVQQRVQTKFEGTFEQSSKSLDKAIEIIYANCLNNSYGYLKLEVLITNAGTTNISSGNWVILLKDKNSGATVNYTVHYKSEELQPSYIYKFTIDNVTDYSGNKITFSTSPRYTVEVRSPVQTIDEVECAFESS